MAPKAMKVMKAMKAMKGTFANFKTKKVLKKAKAMKATKKAKAMKAQEGDYEKTVVFVKSWNSRAEGRYRKWHLTELKNVAGIVTEVWTGILKTEFA
jgi:hypothetical protein